MSALLSHRFFLKAAEPLDTPQTVHLRLILNRRKAELATGVKVLPAEWNSARGRTQRNRFANELLDAWEARVLALKHTDLLKGNLRTASQLKQALLDNKQSSPTAVAYLQRHVDRMAERGNEYAKGSLTPYQSTVRWFAEFLQSRRNAQLMLTQLTRGLCLDFEHYLLTTPLPNADRPMLRNVASKHLSRLRTMLNVAVREEWIEKNPMNGIRLKQERTNRECLTMEELGRLEALDLRAQASLDRVRDLFVFSVYTGLRYKDALSLSPAQLSTDGEGRQWLSLVQHKTGDAVKLPLLQPAVRVLEKYGELPELTGKQLPSLSNQKLNAYLKVLADLAGISKTLTHHVARHTFATTITLTKGVPIEVVSKLLGHRDLATTQIYAKITSDYLGQVAKRLDAELA